MNSDLLSFAEGRLWRRARQYIDAQQLVAAQATLEALVRRVPDEASFRMELARVMFERGQVQRATAQWLQIANAPLPDDPQLILQLVQRLWRVGEVLAARACLDHVSRLPDVAAELWAEQARLRSTLGEIPAAQIAMDRAMANGIDTPDEYYLQATLFQFNGDIPRAEQILEKCLRRWPFFGGAVMALANLRKQTPDKNHVDFLQQQLRRFPVDGATSSDNLVRAEFQAATFKELDDLGRYVEAWSALAESNALMHALNPYNAALETAVTDALISHSGLSVGTGSQAALQVDGPTPIFIVGMPRSGTTLLDRMLSSHSKVVSGGEINDFVRQFHWVADTPLGGMLQAIVRSADIDYAELGARYLKQTQWRAYGHKYYIDKLPANIQMVAFIRKALPHAVILHMVREPMEVCFSNYRAMFGNVSAYSYDFAALAHYYGQYTRLTNHWRSVFPDALLEVSYTELVSTPETTLRRVLQHCGLDFEQACLRPEGNLAPVATPSNIQVREPIHTRSLSQWRRYSEQLEPLRLMLEDDMHGGCAAP